MSWIPSYTLYGGILGGATPAGSLQGIPGFMGDDLKFSTNMAYGGHQNTQNNPDDPLPKWNAAYGSNGDMVTDYIDDHNGATQVTLAEFEIPNPEGATYYKQTLAVRFSGTVTRYTTYGGTWDYFSYAPYSFERRVYADPQSPFVVTDTWTRPGNVGAIVFAKNIQTTQPVPRYASIREYIAFGSFTANGNEYWGVFMYGYGENYSSSRKTTVGSLLAIKIDILDNSFGKFEPEEKKDPNDDPDNPPDDEDGGDGKHRKPDYPIPKPGLPSISAAVAGFLTLYKLTPAEMSVFADDCLASDVWEAIKLLLSNPLDFIVGCSIVPFVPPGNSVWYPKFGAITFSHAYSRIDSQYVSINCGNLYIDPFGKNFLDYAPFTRITIYLPYIGFRELDVNEVMGKTINVEYYCDCLSGDCIAFISLSDVGEEGPQIGKVLATYNGNCACQVPFASQSFNSLIASSVNMLTNVASSVVKGDIPTISGSGIVGALEGIGGDVQKSGSIGSSNGYMGVQIPYLIKHIPKDSIPSAFRALKGYPSNISGALGSFSGYAEIDNIDLSNISTGLSGIVATSAELEEIQTLLRGGVFI